MTSSTSTRSIAITIRGPQAWVAGEVANLVKPVVLQYSSDEGAADQHVHLNPLDGSELFCFPAGLVQRVLQHLEGQGHGVEIENLMHYPALERFRERLAGQQGLEGRDRMRLSQMAQQAQGQAVVSGYQEKLRHLSSLIEMLSGLNVLVVACSRKSALAIANHLNQDGRVAHLDRDEALQHQGRLLVTTAHQYGMEAPHDWNVIVFTDVESALAKRSAAHTMTMRDQVIYLIRDRQKQLGEREEFRLSITCGPIVWPLPARSPRVTVLMVRPPLVPMRFPRDISALQRKRQAIWHNGPRNDLLAGIAKAAVDQDQERLWSLGVMVEPEHFDRDRHSTCVAILVESTEHGRELLKRLPGWRISSAGPVEETNGAEQEGTWELDRWDRAIVTTVQANLVGLAPDVLIRADGGSGSLELSGRALRWANEMRPLVIDLADDGDERMERNTKERTRQYRDMGWYVNPRRGRDGGMRPMTRMAMANPALNADSPVAGRDTGTGTEATHLHLPGLTNDALELKGA